jgi:hypothetical protein
MYGLIHNEKIQVGPRSWNYAFFKEYLDDHSLDASSLPLNEPKISIYGDDWKILKVTEMNIPEIDPIFEQNVGPFWTIHEDHIACSYIKQNKSIAQIKGDLKNIVAANRYEVEVGDVKYTFDDGQEVILYMSREERNIYLNTYIAMDTGETVSFKFKNGIFRANVTQAELSNIVNLGKNQIKEAFEWETQKAAEIDSCSTIEELKLVELRHPSKI